MIGHGDHVLGRKGYRRWGHKLPVARAPQAEPQGQSAVCGVKDLHSVVAGVGDGDPVAGRRVCDGHGIVELPGCGAVGSEHQSRRAIVRVENLHSVVAGVGDGDPVSGRRVGHGVGAVELPGAVAVGSELAVQHAVCVQDLHSVVAGVGDGDPVSGRRVGHGVGAVELPGAVAVGSELAGERAIGQKNLHSVVAGVGDGDPVALGGVRGGSGFLELPGAVAVGSELAGERAIGQKNLHSVVAGVGDGKHAGQWFVRREQLGVCDVIRRVDSCALVVGAPPKPKLKRTVGVEDRDVSFPNVCHGYLVARGREGGGVWVAKIPIVMAGRTKLVILGAIGAEDFDLLSRYTSRGGLLTRRRETNHVRMSEITPTRRP